MQKVDYAESTLNVSYQMEKFGKKIIKELRSNDGKHPKNIQKPVRQREPTSRHMTNGKYISKKVEICFRIRLGDSCA